MIYWIKLKPFPAYWYCCMHVHVIPNIFRAWFCHHDVILCYLTAFSVHQSMCILAAIIPRGFFHRLLCQTKPCATAGIRKLWSKWNQWNQLPCGAVHCSFAHWCETYPMVFQPWYSQCLLPIWLLPWLIKNKFKLYLTFHRGSSTISHPS